MTSESNRDWRSLLGAMILAYWEDVRRGFESTSPGSEARFLEHYGTDALRSGRARAIMNLREQVTRTELPTSYEIVQESGQQVIAQVSPRSNWPLAIPVPVRPTRVHLLADEAGWHVAGIFQACQICNASMTASELFYPRRSSRSFRGFLPGLPPLAPQAGPGKCIVCRGSGARFGVPTSDFLRARGPERDSMACESCGGTGRCSQCRLEELPGWLQVFSLSGLKVTMG
jgi:hypothetical protein